MNPDGLNLLRYAIVKQAVRDYLDALRVLRRNNRKSRMYYRAEYVIASCETFFEKYCDYFVDVDGVELMELIREKSYDPTFRVREEETI